MSDDDEGSARISRSGRIESGTDGQWIVISENGNPIYYAARQDLAEAFLEGYEYSEYWG